MLIVCKRECTTLDCLIDLWRLFKAHKGSYEAMKTCGEIFTLVCGNLEDVKSMEKELKDVFRPAAYRQAAVAKIKPKVAGPNNNNISSPKKKETAIQRRRRSLREQKQREEEIRHPQTNEDDANDEIKRPNITTFNLCNGMIDEASFTATCKQCPSIVEHFEMFREEHLSSSNVSKLAPAKSISVAERVKDIKKRKVSLVM